MPKVTLPTWPATPLMVPLKKTLQDGGFPPTQFTAGIKGDADENWRKFATQNVANLQTRAIGNAQHLNVAYMNALRADLIVRSFGEKIQTEGLPDDLRANFASVNIMGAVAMLHSAILVHMRNNLHHHAALILCRSALELTARAALLATSNGDEPSRWQDGPKLPSEKERRAAELTPSACCDKLLPLVQAARTGAIPPRQVYTWLCRFTHLDSVALTTPPSSDASYAAIAYTGWLCAVVAEVITDWPGLAEWPTAWPSPLPWA